MSVTLHSTNLYTFFVSTQPASAALSLGLQVANRKAFDKLNFADKLMEEAKISQLAS